jgi:hypothetical protein
MKQAPEGLAVDGRLAAHSQRLSGAAERGAPDRGELSIDRQRSFVGAIGVEP